MELELVNMNVNFFKDFLPAKMKPYVVATAFERVVKQVSAETLKENPTVNK